MQRRAFADRRQSHANNAAAVTTSSVVLARGFSRSRAKRKLGQQQQELARPAAPPLSVLAAVFRR